MTKIAVTMRYDFFDSVGEFRECLDVEWPLILESAGFFPVLISSGVDDVRDFIEAMGVDGIVLTGGGQPDSGDPRETLEKKILTLAQKNGIPVFGVCRGFQQMNLFLGGRVGRSSSHVGTNHPVSGVLFDESPVFVNSFHHNVISEQDLASGFQTVAQSKDSFVEAALHRVLPWLGIMWHPERPGNDVSAGPAMVSDFFSRRLR